MAITIAGELESSESRNFKVVPDAISFKTMLVTDAMTRKGSPTFSACLYFQQTQDRNAEQCCHRYIEYRLSLFTVGEILLANHIRLTLAQRFDITFTYIHVHDLD